MSGSPDPAAQVDAYVASLFEALGSRDALETLAATPQALAGAVAGLSSTEEGTPEAPGKWSVRQVVQHLADSELVSGFRYRMVLSHEAPLLPGYDQDLWAARLGYAHSDIPTALVDFTRLREANLRLLVRATTTDFERVMRHAERGDESLEKMIRMHAGHDLVHLRQVARIRRAVGA
jgi:hypothetical protein